jgi:hypothetical protein
MSRRNNVHVVPNPDGGWKVKRENAKRASKLTETKKEAMDYARELAKTSKVELIPHGKKGKIQNPDSHGNDSFPPRG